MVRIQPKPQRPNFPSAISPSIHLPHNTQPLRPAEQPAVPPSAIVTARKTRSSVRTNHFSGTSSGQTLCLVLGVIISFNPQNIPRRQHHCPCFRWRRPGPERSSELPGVTGYCSGAELPAGLGMQASCLAVLTHSLGWWLSGDGEGCAVMVPGCHCLPQGNNAEGAGTAPTRAKAQRQGWDPRQSCWVSFLCHP